MLSYIEHGQYLILKMCKANIIKIFAFLVVTVATLVWIIDEDLLGLEQYGNIETVDRHEIEPNRINYFLQKYVKGMMGPLEEQLNRTGK